MKGSFEVAGGSITGRNHCLVGKNNQDAYYSLRSELATIAVVCDGCGSGKHSEVGAKLGARLIVETINQKLNQLNLPDFWQQLTEEIQHKLKSIATTFTNENSLPYIVHEYFLFTVVGALVTPSETLIFSIGDGVIALNGKIKQIGPFPGNAPPYLGYGLLENSDFNNFQIHHQISTYQIESILIGTDGVIDIIKSASFALPGNRENVGLISQFWQEDRYFKNPDMVRRRLSLINREVTKLNFREVGLLPDDTTLIVIRKSPTYL